MKNEFSELIEFEYPGGKRSIANKGKKNNVSDISSEGSSDSDGTEIIQEDKLLKETEKTEIIK